MSYIDELQAENRALLSLNADLRALNAEMVAALIKMRDIGYCETVDELIVKAEKEQKTESSHSVSSLKGEK